MKLYIQRVHLNKDGYPSDGRYFGIGAPLFHYFNDDASVNRYIRANDREHAKALVRKNNPSI